MVPHLSAESNFRRSMVCVVSCRVVCVCFSVGLVGLVSRIQVPCNHMHGTWHSSKCEIGTEHCQCVCNAITTIYALTPNIDILAHLEAPNQTEKAVVVEYILQCTFCMGHDDRRHHHHHHHHQHHHLAWVHKANIAMHKTTQKMGA